MDFGKLSDISGVNFELPEDPPFTAETLSLLPPKGDPQIFVGCPVWVNPEWIGDVYPIGTKPKDYLHYYAHTFNTIELNPTHYGLPDEMTLYKWCQSAPEGFTFCPKVPQEISHKRRLMHAEEPTLAFQKTLAGFGHHLGTAFLQLSPWFTPREGKNLLAWLENWPKRFPLAVEFRHPDWFTGSRAAELVFESMRKLGIGLVITDVSGRRDVLHMRLSSDTLTLRFVGNALHPTDYSRSDAWMDRIADWTKAGLKSAYIFIHQPENDESPDLSRYWLAGLNERLNLNLEIVPPRRGGQQQSLF